MNEANEHEYLLGYFLKDLADINILDVLSGVLESSCDLNQIFCPEISEYLKEATQYDILNFIEQSGLDDNSKFLILSCALKNSRKDSEWILYNITKLLNNICNNNSEFNRSQLVVYAMLTLGAFKEGEEGCPLPLSILAKELRTFAPRLAIIYGLKAAQMGLAEGALYVPGCSNDLGLGLDFNVDLTGIKSLRKILNISGDVTLPIIPLNEADGYNRTTFCKPETKILPKPAGASEHYIFQDRKASYEIPGISVHHFEGGYYSIDTTYVGRTNFYVFDKNKNCINELSHGFAPFITEDVLQIDQDVCVLDDSFSGAMNICHFILDRLARMPIYESVNTNVVYAISDSFPYYKELIDLVGISQKFIFFDAKRTTIKCKNLYVSSDTKTDFFHPLHMGAGWAIDYLDNLFFKLTGSGPSPSKRILISRADAKGRAITNWKEVANLCSDFGFSAVSLTGMPIIEQINLFRAATDVVSVHGAGLTNIIFSNKNCRVLEIVPPLIATHAYWVLANAKGQKYEVIIGRDPSGIQPDYTNWVHDASNNFRDVTVPLGELHAYLCKLD
ncbi:glycosyltransferase family 61 protein [Methylorubrum extorquens]|uniref:glycosyltransferase family 61 protein n=1 Tax=Methylorubrum extorquens TaxID=408 RepID=UPI00209E61A9|nr:glycosyltransferase family 61 protein [Methylorubrum extorquens]MCP1538106.1 hypothetical protein [Methylorubrum extorquens]